MVECKMLGEKISEMKGKVVYSKVLEVTNPTMETTVESHGKINDVEVSETITFVSSPIGNGTFHGIGKGIVLAGSEMATFTGEALGSVGPSGTMRWHGSTIFKTESNGKLRFLNNTFAVFEAEIDTNQDFVEQTWIWK